MKRHPHVLHLASQSISRKQLLEESQIPFRVIEQTADEGQCDWALPAQQLVLSLAQLKMNHVVIPSDDVDCLFVLTADTLTCDRYGIIHGKPDDIADAIKKIKRLSEGQNAIHTAFCLEKRIRNESGKWQTEAQISDVVSSWCKLCVPEDWIDAYMQNKPVLHVSGALAIEGYAMQFVEYLNGSYTGIIGLPMFEVRQALIEIGFFH